jgi:hypothetical protein
MALYASNNLLGGTQQSLSSSFKTITALTAETTTLGVSRGFIYEILIGADGAPNATDCAIQWDLSAITAAGTATTAIPVALDGADIAGRITADVNATAEPTYTAASSRWALGANQRASYRWQVNPCGPGEIVIPATDEAGFGLRAKSVTYASTVVGHLYHRE